MLEVVPPTHEPLTLAEARVHLRQGADGDSPGGDSPYWGDSPSFYGDVPDDSWIISKITAARQSCEDYLGYPLTDAVYLLVYQDFSGRSIHVPSNMTGHAGWGYPLQVPWQPFWQSPGFQLPPGIGDVESIQYLDPVSHQAMAISSSGFDFDPVTRMIYNDLPWPTVSTRAGAVRIKVRGVYGYDSPALLVPETIKHAMLLMLGEWYENRSITIDGRVGQMSLGIEFLLRPLRTRLGMA